MNKELLVFASFGFELFGIVLCAIWIGPYLESTLGLGSIGMLAFIVLGWLGVFVKMFILLRRLQKK